jgi:hypothetical protein
MKPDPTRTLVNLQMLPTNEIFLDDLARVTKTHPGYVVDLLIEFSKQHAGQFLLFLSNHENQC